MNPTHETYAEFQQAFDFFNDELFEGRLPRALITLQRQHDSHGYFSPDQFVSINSPGEFTHEIALNPIYFVIRSIHETLSVLVREMVSLDQFVNGVGKKPRRRYRNREWAEMCEAVGLMPSDTGRPGGKKTGDSVQTYIIDGGAFDLASSKLVDTEFHLSWVDRYPPEVQYEAPAADPTEPVSGAGHANDAHRSQLDAGVTEVLDELARPDEEGGGSILGTDDDGEHLPELPALNPFAEEKAAAKQKKLEEETAGAPKMKVFAHTESLQLAQMGIEPKKTAKNLSKTKFSCTVCKANAWGKPSLKLYCGGTEKKPHDVELMPLQTDESEAESGSRTEVF